MERDSLIDKLVREERLTAPEEAQLDTMLGQDDGRVRKLVASTPDESLSLAWRSNLNERLIALQPSQKPTRSWFARLGPAVGFAAVALAVWLVQTRPLTSDDNLATDNAATVSVEAQLLAAHREAASVIDVSNVSSIETTPSGAAVRGMEWSESDLGAL